MSKGQKLHVKKKDEYSLAFFLAIKNTFHRISMLSLILVIISLGYLSTTFSSSVIHGLQFTIEEKAINTLSGNIFIEPNDEDLYLDNIKNLKKKVQSIPEVVSTSDHLVKSITLIDDDGNMLPTQVKIVNPEDEAKTTIIDNNIIAGSYLSNSATNGEIIIGADATKKYRNQEALSSVDIDAGEKIMAVTNSGKVVNLKVKGVYGIDFAVSDMYVYMSRSDAKIVFDLSDEDLTRSSKMLVKTVSRDEEFAVIDKLKNLGLNAKVWRWKEKLGILDDFVNSLMIISNLTAIIGVIIAFSTIYVMIYINVIQKRSQIGILKAIGVTKKTILLSYVFQSGIYGILGAGLGVWITYILNSYFGINPIVMPMGDVYPIVTFVEYMKSFLLILVSSFIAGYYASRGVIKENILDAIYKG